MIKLKPCPFCGTSNQAIFAVQEEYLMTPESKSIANRVKKYRLYCGWCECGTPWRRHEEDAIEAWNNRVVEKSE